MIKYQSESPGAGLKSAVFIVARFRAAPNPKRKSNFLFDSLQPILLVFRQSQSNFCFNQTLLRRDREKLFLALCVNFHNISTSTQTVPEYFSFISSEEKQFIRWGFFQGGTAKIDLFSSNGFFKADNRPEALSTPFTGPRFVIYSPFGRINFCPNNFPVKNKLPIQRDSFFNLADTLEIDTKRPSFIFYQFFSLCTLHSRQTLIIFNAHTNFISYRNNLSTLQKMYS